MGDGPNGWRVQGPQLTWTDVQGWAARGERRPLVVFGHQCLGDHIICAGAYRHLSKLWSLRLIIRPGMESNLQLLLGDVPDLQLLVVDEAQQPAYADSLQNVVMVRMGAYSGVEFNHWHFDQEFYRHANIDFEARWGLWRCPEVPQLPVPAQPYRFVHERPEYFGARIDLVGVRPRPESSVFAHRDIIMGAQELHCCSSAFAAFADSFLLHGKGLHFYNFGREIPTHLNKWIYH